MALLEDIKNGTLAGVAAGVGATLLAPVLLPAAARLLRPALKEVVRAGFVVSAATRRRFIPPPSIERFGAGVSEIKRGESTVITWNTTDAEEVLLNDEEVAPTGQIEVSPRQTARYTLVAINSVGRDEQSLEVTVRVIPAKIDQFEAAPRIAAPGETVTLSWQTSDAEAVLLDSEKVDAIGSMKVRAKTSARYALLAVNEAGSDERVIEIEVSELPIIDRFEAAPAKVSRGKSVALSWETRNVEKVFLNEEEVDPSGKFRRFPKKTTDYELRVVNSAGEQNRVVTARVTT